MLAIPLVGIFNACSQAFGEPLADLVMTQPAPRRKRLQGVSWCIAADDDDGHIADLGHQVVVAPFTLFPELLPMVASDDQVAFTFQAIEPGQDLTQQIVQVKQSIVVTVALRLRLAVLVGPGQGLALQSIVGGIGQVSRA
ncbi:hypothetical protein D3C72_2059700 [compost metagenome]